MNLNNQTPSAQLGPYLVYFTLGKGGFAEVKIAKEHGTDQICAIKIFKNNLNTEAIFREAEIMGLVKHKNIPTLIDWTTSAPYVKENGQQGEVAVLVMEYLPNGSLSHYLKAFGGVFSEDMARSLFQSLIETLEYIHSQGIVHRDLKPDNLLFDENFNLKIGDFGIAAYFKDQQGNILLKDFFGTENYAAPEILLRTPYSGPEVDIFSCGVILFNLVTGRKPFVKANPKEDGNYEKIATKKDTQFWKVLDEDLGRNLGNQFRELISSMLAFQPHQRSTIQEIKAHPWFHGPVLSPERMKESMKCLKEQIDESKVKTTQKKTHTMEEEKRI